MSLVVFKSSAGSGKTFTLVFEFLRLCLSKPNEPDYFRQILALTFTNKATAEMKHRILNVLEGLSSENSMDAGIDAMRDLLCASLKINTQEVKNRAANVFKGMLHRYDNVAVMTIDKFTGKLIRSFSAELGVNSDFTVELDAEKIVKLAVNQLLEETATDNELAEILKEFSIRKAQEGKSHRISKLLFDFALLTLNEEHWLHLEEYRAFSITELNEYKRKWLRSIQQIRNTAKDLMHAFRVALREHRIDEIDLKYSDTLISYFNKIEQGLLTPPGKRVMQVLESDSWVGTKSPSAKTFQGELPMLQPFYERFCAYVQEHYGNYALLSNASDNFETTVILSRIEKIIAEIKEASNLIFISDFNHKISNVVSVEPAPYIYERTGSRFKHLMIDEFQDTSVMQWQNLIPLVDECLSNGEFTMLVGDTKQAIYRFRGGEADQFASLPESYLSRGIRQRIDRSERALDMQRLMRTRALRIMQSYREENLIHNRRSLPVVVDFNNSLYKHASTYLSDSVRWKFTEFEQISAKLGNEGFVQVAFFDEKSMSESFEEATLTYLLQTVKQCLNDGCSPGDIAVLTQKNSTGAKVAQTLLLNEYSVVSADSLLVDSSVHVKLLINMATAFSTKNSWVEAAAAIRYLCEEKLLPADSFLLKDKANLGDVLNAMNIDLDLVMMKTLPVYDYFVYLIGKLNITLDINVQYLLEEAHAFSLRNGNQISAFCEYWKQNKQVFKVALPDSDQSINVLTYHKAKGLEYPVVIMPFAEIKSNESNSHIWHEREDDFPKNILLKMNKSLEDTEAAMTYLMELHERDLDKLNALYVATTRTRERLYVHTHYVAKEGGSMSVPSIFSSFCTSNPDKKISEYIYEWGKTKPKVNINSSPITDMDQEVYHLEGIGTFWRSMVLTASENADKLIHTQHLQSGNLFHEAIRNITDVSQVSKVLEKLRLEGHLQEELDVLQFQLTETLNATELADFFNLDNTILVEQAILSKDGSTLRPDRILIKEKDAYLLDFKTGIPYASHGDQLINYKQILTEMGYCVKKSYLFYSASAQLKEVL